MKLRTLGSVALVTLVAAACGGLVADQEGAAGQVSNGLGASDKLDRVLAAAVEKAATGPAVMPGGLMRVRHGQHQGQAADFVDVLIAADATAVPKLAQLGAVIRTVTPSGILTASAPLHKIAAMAALSDVFRIEGAKSVQKSMDMSKGETGLALPVSMRPTDGTPHTGGAGVIVGVIDTGIDWSHDDFRNEDGSTRLRAVWDQSDRGDAQPPSGFTYGHTYARSEIDACLTGGGGHCAQKDTDGHGTHVAGTAAGNGRAFGTGSTKHQLAGIAPDAEIVIVKFDFDGDRNTDAAIVDGVNWMFQQAAAAGKPIVVNASLGSDYGPHDGSTLEERGLSDLTGPGKIFVAAAGNPGRSSDSPNLALWGHPLHGSGDVPVGGYSTITIDVPAGAGAGDYVFFDIWYEGGDATQVQIVSPSGKMYPPNFTGPNKTRFKTGSPTAAYNTAEGYLLVGNGGDQLGFDTNNGDHELYVELSDGAAVVAPGAWQIRVYDRGQTQGGVYHGWHGTSSRLSMARPRYEGRGTDNAMTVGAPATGREVISIGAFTTKMAWEYLDLDPRDGTCTPTAGTPCCMTYNVGGLSYYDPFFVDANNNGAFDHSFTPGTCDVATSEPFHTIAFFSARGPTRDGRVVPNVAAPGVGIVASASADMLAIENAQTDVSKTYYRRSNRISADGKHVVLQGTSMASPHGTGSVALLLEKNAFLTPAQARSILASSARGDALTGALPNNDWGSGKVDVTAALAATPSACTTNDTCGGGICCAGACISPVCTSDAACGSNRICNAPGTCSAACANAPGGGTCASVGSSCDAMACCSGTCKGKPGNRTCR